MSRADVIAQVADERDRQIELGWTPDHDDEHPAGFLVDLAFERCGGPGGVDRPELIEAAALIVAEIERLDRIEGSE